MLISLERLSFTRAQIFINLLTKEKGHVRDWCRYILKINNLTRTEVRKEQWGLSHVDYFREFRERQGACLTSSSGPGTVP